MCLLEYSQFFLTFVILPNSIKDIYEKENKVLFYDWNKILNDTDKIHIDLNHAHVLCEYDRVCRGGWKDKCIRYLYSSGMTVSRFQRPKLERRVDDIMELLLNNKTSTIDKNKLYLIMNVLEKLKEHNITETYNSVKRNCEAHDYFKVVQHINVELIDDIKTSTKKKETALNEKSMHALIIYLDELSTKFQFYLFIQPLNIFYTFICYCGDISNRVLNLL